MICPHCTKLISDEDAVNDLVNRRIISLPIETGPEITLIAWTESQEYLLIDIDKENREILVEAPWTRKPFWIPLPKRVKIEPFKHQRPRDYR